MAAPDGDLAHQVAEVVAPLRKTTVVLRASETKSASYLGGRPPAFPGLQWPDKDGRPLGFLACIDLSQVGAIDWLPRAGLLLFFYDLDKQPWGFDPKDGGGWAVIHLVDSTEVTGVAAFPAGLEADWRLPRRDITFRVASIPPPWELAPLDSPDHTDEQAERLWNALDDLREAQYGPGPKHQIGGYPKPIQGAEMELECQLASNGIYVGDPSGYQDPRVAALREGAKDWRLLLQVDSDDDLNVMWGDVGMIYFWVREQDARRGDFTKTWLILQCH